MNNTQILLSDSSIKTEKVLAAKTLITENQLSLSTEQIINAHENVLKEYYTGYFHHKNPEKFLEECEYVFINCLMMNIKIYEALMLAINDGLHLPSLTFVIKHDENKSEIGLGSDSIETDIYFLRVLQILMSYRLFEINDFNNFIVSDEVKKRLKDLIESRKTKCVIV